MVKYNWFNQGFGQKSITRMDQHEITALGASLRQIDRKLLSPTNAAGATRIWYQGGEPYFDVFVELRNGKIEWFQFTLRGKSLSWNAALGGWQTGRTNEFRTDDVTFYPASKLIESDYQPDLMLINLAYSILKTRAGEDDFERMLALFEE